MKRYELVLAVMAVVLGAALMVTQGCTPKQVQVVAQQAGIASVATWVAVDNPTPVQKNAAKIVVKAIYEGADAVNSNESYTVVLTPVINKIIQDKVAPQDRLLCTLASGWILGGIDTLFAMNPHWQTNNVAAAATVRSFCDGAMVGLSMAGDDPVMRAAARSREVRLKAVR